MTSLPQVEFMSSDTNNAVKTFRRDLLKNWGCFKRSFAWRETKDPFHILTAEILLQKTNARAVESVYKKVVDRYPTPYELAVADVDELILELKASGLAYRAQRLIAIAKIIVSDHKGSVPNTLDELLSLPGVGYYAARAVACFAFN